MLKKTRRVSGTPRKSSVRSGAFRYELSIHDGMGGEIRRRITQTYPKTPATWTGSDLLKVCQAAALAACQVMRRPPTRTSISLHISSQYEGNQLEISQATGAWARIRPQFHVPTIAVAEVLSVTPRIGCHSIDVPALEKPDAAEVRKQRKELMAWLTAMQAHIEAEGGAR